MTAAIITYPHEVLRARMQDARLYLPISVTTSGQQQRVAPSQKKMLGLVATLRGIIKNEGVLSLWSGLRINLIRVVPATAATFLAYECISKYLDNLVP